jgi:hypothetical protein
MIDRVGEIFLAAKAIDQEHAAIAAQGACDAVRDGDADGEIEQIG